MSFAVHKPGRLLCALFGGSWLATGCQGPCDTAALGAATDAAGVEAACALPADLSVSWTCSEPMPTSNDAETLRAVHGACELSALGSEERFVSGQGDPARAAAVYAWMQQNEVAGADAAARLIAGEPPFEGELALPSLPGATGARPEGSPVTVATKLYGFGAWGPYPGQALDSISGDPLLSVDASLDVGSLRHAMASVGSPGQPVHLAVAADGVAWYPLYLPTEAPEGARLRLEEDGSFTAEGAPVAVPPTSGKVLLEVDDDATLSALTAALGKLGGAEVSLSMDYLPCGKAPSGMVCLPGSEGIQTYYVDTNATRDAKACSKDGVCRSSEGSWSWAREYCTWQGKRLPTAWEWDRAQERGLLPTDAAPQWTLTWEGSDPGPLGTCGGAPRCWTSKKRMGSDDRAYSPTSKLEGPVFCVSSQRWLSTRPPDIIANPRPAPKPTEPDPALAKIANDIDQDNLEDKGICPKDVREAWAEHQKSGGRSTTECRDPMSYVTSNEPRRHVWAEHFRNLGGGYVGVGSDQNYDFIAVANSEWAWVFDYDPNVVRLHQMLKPLVVASDSPAALVARFESANADSTVALLREQVADEVLREDLVEFYYAYRGKLRDHYAKSMQPSATQGDFGWLRTADSYNTIRRLYSQDRIVPIAMDMLGTHSMRSVGAAASEMGIPIRIYYTSNAPTAWGGQITEDYRLNVTSLPFDEDSVVLATFNWGGFGQTGYWHYNVMNGLLFQERMAVSGYDHNGHEWGPIWDRVPGNDPDLTTSALRGVGPF